MISTGIFIRVEIGGRWQSIDIGDPRLNAEQLLEWLVNLSDEGVLRAVRRAEAVIAQVEGE
jgi:hypothetical protein